jgi:plastocyanin
MKKRMIGALTAATLAALTLTGISTPAWATNTTFYVNNQAGSNCSDTGPASLAQPWCTFTPINSHGAFGPGDKILLAKGATWNQQMNLSGSGTASNGISVSAYGSGTNPKISRNGSVDDRGIKLVNGDYWSFSHLEVSDAASGILAYYDTTGHNGLSFDDVYVHEINGFIYYKHNNTGSALASATADNIRNSSGIQITGKHTTFSASDYFIRGVRMNYVSGDHNLNTIGIDMLGPGEQVTSNVGGSGGAGAGMVRNVVIDHLTSHDDNWQCDEALRLFTVTHAVVMNSALNNEAPCWNVGGTTTVILGHLEDVSIVNSMFTNVMHTGSNDENALDFEIFNNNVRARNSLFANTAGSAMSFLRLGGRPGDYSTNNESSSNVMINNGVAQGFGPVLVLNMVGASSPITGTIKDNINVNRNFLYDQGNGFAGFSTTNNRTLSNGSGDVYFSAADFSGVQGQNGWSYQSFDGSSYTNLIYNSTYKKWTPPGQSVPEITQFDQHPGASATNWVARAWTAPSTGTVSLRGRILKSDNVGGGNGILARITKNGQQVWPASGTQTVAAGDEYTGVSYVLDNLSVNAGDTIRFETNENGESSYDRASWTPSVSYTSRQGQAYNWGFNSGHEAGWNVYGATSSTAMGTDPNALNLTSNGNDPRVESASNQLHLNAATASTVTVRMSNATSSTAGRLYFTTTSSPGPSESKAVPFAVQPNSGYTTYTIDVASNPLWTGEVNWLRVDPIDTTGQTNIDSIVVSGTGDLFVNRLRDGGFEDPSANFYSYEPASVWQYLGSTGVQRNHSAFSGAQSAADGQQTAFIQGTDSVKQALNLSAGAHTVTFSVAQRTNNGGAQALDFYVDGTRINASAFAPPSSGAFQSFTSPSFTTTNGSHTLEFRGTTAGDNTAFLDKVTIE